MKDNVLGYESLGWIIEQSEDGLFVATATPRMQREIAKHYSGADVCVYDYSTDVKPFTFSVPARLFRDNPDKRAYLLLNVQLSLIDENGQFDDALLERLNFCRDMFAREKKNIVFFMTEEAARQLNLKAYDLHSYIRLFLKFEDDLPDEAALIELPETPPDRSVGVEPPEIDYGKPRNALLAQAIALNNRAKQYYDDGRYRDAETLARGVLDIRTRLLGADSPDTAAAHYMLGRIEKRLARYNEAIMNLETALEIQKRTLGERHPDTATTYNNIGEVYSGIGDNSKALYCFNAAISINKEAFGEYHQNTAESYNDIASVFYDMGDIDKATDYLKKALAIYESLFGESHPSTAMTYNNLAFICYSTGRYAESLIYYFKALKAYEQTLGKHHPKTGTVYGNIALAYYAFLNYNKALEYGQKSLAIFEEAFGKDHPRTKIVRDNLAILRNTIENNIIINRRNST